MVSLNYHNAHHRDAVEQCLAFFRAQCGVELNAAELRSHMS